LTTFRHESSGAEAATPRLEREELGRRGFADLIEVVMVEAYLIWTTVTRVE